MFSEAHTETRRRSPNLKELRRNLRTAGIRAIRLNGAGQGWPCCAVQTREAIDLVRAVICAVASVG